ncbi:NUDIX hydrolase [Aliikangiella maris]|uniref:NUDIX hydrolase n=2 Tax=Aliikangiella maris TaxID=3162458 RepID=A0ABV2BS89_9GAMM
MDIKFCIQCGNSTHLTIPEMDTHHRHQCQTCGFIHYQNPNIIAGCLVYHREKVLLCKRAIEPRYGLWTVPAGFMENGESTRAAAIRETREEANAMVELKDLFFIANLVPINQVYMLYLAELVNEDFYAGIESLDVQLFSEQQIPWENLAFKTVEITLKKFFQARQNNQFELHEIEFKADRSVIWF